MLSVQSATVEPPTFRLMCSSPLVPRARTTIVVLPPPLELLELEELLLELELELELELLLEPPSLMVMLELPLL